MSNDKFGLKPSTIVQMQQVFAQFDEIDAVVVYGSRAKGNYHDGSDIDLTVHTHGKVDSDLLFSITGELDKLELVYGVDLSLYQYIDNDNLKDHIKRVGKTFYHAEKYHKLLQAQEIQQQKRDKEENRHLPDTALSSEGYQSEAELEASLIERLVKMDYQLVSITNTEELHQNLKRQLEIHNKIELSNGEFNKIVNHLNKGNVFQRAKTLRDRFLLNRDDGTSCHIQFMNILHWCQNQYQVTSQFSQTGKYQNRYDVTLLINGLPLVQIELKRRGIELKEAFNQINRYQRHSFWAESGLFNYVQLFVISNGVNTKYYANNRKQDFKQTFYWSDEQNNLVTQLNDFTDQFLEKCHVSKMISQYIVLHESDKILMVLRPYQYFAVEAIIDRVKAGREHGYIWHTTGSGKTLTSFKAAQIMTRLPKVHKVVFVVDRADLDYQTTREFNYFSPGSVDGTNNTASLVKQMAGHEPLIVTTIQKLNKAITAKRHETSMEALKDKRVVFIFDECHRSQFGDTHKNIVEFFTNAQMFGFTGTPIFKDNAIANKHGKRTTKKLFGERLHKYVIKDAISDENVLKFSVEYLRTFKNKQGDFVDEKVAKIDKREAYMDDRRIENVVNWIIKHHDSKTHNRQFSAIMCVTDKEMLFQYYDKFKEKQLSGEHDLRVVTIFTYGVNEDDADANGLIGDPDFDIKNDDPKNKHSREKLEQYVADYNALYKTRFSVKDSNSFYAYYKDIAKRMKERDKEDFKDQDRADILLVVNMFLTGFDAKKLNTLYVDKNLKYHGLVQAFSRTNRILGELKSQGNIVCFRNLKDNTDEAIKLFCDTEANEDILMEPYEFYVEQFNRGLDDLHALAETPDAVNDLLSEDAKLAFVKAYRHLARTLNKLKPFTEFQWPDLEIDEQTFEDYQSKYLDIYDSSHDNEPGASILDQIDFELELIHRDEINVAYILALLGQLHQQQAKKGKKSSAADTAKAKQDIMDMLGKEVQLRSKRELIERFINDYMPKLTPEQDLQKMFVGFWHQQKRAEIHQLCERENMDKDGFYRLIDEYHFTGKEPLRQQFFDILNYRPKLMQRKNIYTRVLNDFKNIIQKYEDDTGNLGLGEDPAQYHSAPLNELVHRLGDKEIFFSDEIKHSDLTTELARFTIKLDQPYKQQLARLQPYQIGSELLGRGIVNDEMLTAYLDLTAQWQNILAKYDLSFDLAEHCDDGMLFWSLSEAREGSTVLEFILNVWGYSLAIGGPIMAFLAAYPKAADGLERLKADINKRFKKADEQSPIILTRDIIEHQSV